MRSAILRIRASVITALLVGFAIAADHGPAEAQPSVNSSVQESIRTDQSSSEFQRIASEEGGFAANLPTGAKLETVRTPNKGYVYYKALGKAGELTYQINAVDLSEDEKNLKFPQGAMKAFRDGVYEGKTISDDQEIMLELRVPGREFAVDFGRGTYLRERLYLDRHRLFQLMAFGPKAAMTAKAEEIDKFFDSFVIVGPRAEEDAAADVKKLQGRWQVGWEQRGGHTVYDAETVIVTDDQISIGPSSTLPGAGDEFNPPTKVFRLDPTKTPKAIDLVYGSQLSQGIYTLDGDLLRLCIADAGVKRPTSFAAPPASRRDSYIAVRQTEGEFAFNPLRGNYRILGAEDGRATIDGPLFVARTSGREIIGTLETDETTTPARFDLAMHQDGKIVMAYGVYHFENEDSLALSFVEGRDPKDRPSDFQPASGTSVMKLQRLAPDVLRDESAAAQLQGRWRIDPSYQVYGISTIVVTDKSISLRRDGDAPGPFSDLRDYRVDAGTIPYAIDVTDNDQIRRGIYYVEGEELRICIGPQGEERPTAFGAEDVWTMYFVATRQWDETDSENE